MDMNLSNFWETAKDRETWRAAIHGVSKRQTRCSQWTARHCAVHVCSTQKWVTLSLLLLLNRFSRVRLCTTPQAAAHQAPPSLGFSRQEHWSGLPLPSLMHESEKWKWSRSVVSDSATSWTAAYQAPLSMRFSRQGYWSGVPLPSPDFAPRLR